MAEVVQDFITDVLVDIGALTQGQTPNPEESSFVFRSLNRMLDEWSADRTNLFTQTEAVLPLSAKQTFQIGPGAADFPGSPRPTRIEKAAYIIPGTTIHEEVAVVNDAEWASIKERGRQGQLVEQLYCDYAYPFANLNVYPIPNNAGQLSIFMWSVLAQFVTLQDPFAFPTGYEPALLKALGVRISNSFHSPLVDQLYVASAQQARNAVRALNASLLGNSLVQSLTAPVPGGAPPAEAQATPGSQPPAQ